MSYPPSETDIPGDGYTDKNSLVFDLRVRCDKNPDGQNSTDPRVRFFDSNVYAGMVKFGPQQNQSNEFADGLPTVVNPDILLVKLRPGQVSQPDPLSLFSSTSLMHHFGQLSYRN